MKLNRNSPLIWEAVDGFIDAPHSETAVDDAVNIVVNAESLEIEPLLNDASTYGINASSLEITVQDNIVTPATWDATSGKITYYPPAGIVVGGARTLKYKWMDVLGHESNEATITITPTARSTSWRPLTSSRYCVTSSGSNTGMAAYTTLEKYYTDDNTAAAPAVTKPNTIGDPDYVAPSEDLLMCPLPSTTMELDLYVFANYNPDADEFVMSVELQKTGGSNTIVYPYMTAADSQPLVIACETGAHDYIKVRVLNAAGRTLVFNAGTGGSGSGPLSVVTDDEIKTFATVTLGPDATITLY